MGAWDFSTIAGSFVLGLLAVYLVARLCCAAYFTSKRDYELRKKELT